MECEGRTKSGCFENNNWMGEAERCTKHTTGDTCLAQATDCSEGVCSGTAASGKACGERNSDGECTGGDSGCTWKAQCCQWLATPTDMAATCKDKGKGTMDGMCEWSDGSALPKPDILKAGFEY